MVVCPSCGSSRIRNDYKPAPLALRVIGVRALLCDFCNRQFRAFSPAPPRNRNSNYRGRSRNGFYPATRSLNYKQIDPGKEPIKLKLEASRLFLSIESNQQQQIKVDLSGFVSTNAHHPIPANGPVVAIPPDLRTKITKQHELQSVKETQALNGVKENHKSNATCPECGSNWVRRRQRSGLERVVFAITNHKAFICRSCDASFYSRIEDEESATNIIGSSRSAQT